eukprot:363674-Prymnesium_polylepis.1
MIPRVADDQVPAARQRRHGRRVLELRGALAVADADLALPQVPERSSDCAAPIRQTRGRDRAGEQRPHRRARGGHYFERKVS